MKTKNRIMQSTVVLMAVIIFSKLLGLLRDVVLANYFGTSNVSDAYLIAITVPTLLFYFIGHSLSTAFQPIYNRVLAKEGEHQADRFANNLICIALLLCSVIVITLFVFPLPIVRLFAPGFDNATAALSASFVRDCAFSLFFMAVINVWGGYLNVKRNFIIPALISVPRNIIMIFSIAIAARTDVHVLGFGILMSYVGEFLLLFPFVLRSGLHPELVVDLRSEYIKETLQMIVPIIIGVGVSQINKIIDRAVASSIETGGISSLTYASVINNAVQEVLVTGIITILFAQCASWVANGQHDIVKKKLGDTINVLVFLLVPATFGIIACSEDIVKIMLGRGKFDALSAKMTAGALACYTVGLPFLAIRDTLVKVFYAYKNTRTTTITSISAVLINIILNLVFSRIWGTQGLAAATSCSAIWHSVVLYILLRKQIGDFNCRGMIRNLMKSTISAVIMYVFIIWEKKTLSGFMPNELSIMALNVVSGVIVYSIISFLLKTDAIVDLSRRNKK